MSNSTREKIEFLVNFLEKFAEEKKEEVVRAESDYIEGRAIGCCTAYQLCAKWIKEIIDNAD